MRLDDPRLAELAGATPRAVGGRLVRRGVGRPPAVHRRRPARGRRDPPRPPQAVPADLRPVRRASLLRRRRHAARRAVAARGRRRASAICEDFWHLAVPQLLALDGAQILINVSSSPGRDLAATNEVGLGTATSWRTLMRTYAQLTTSFVVFCNRVGVDESISFWGGSEVIAPDRRSRSSARRSTTRGCSRSTSRPADIRRERIALPLLRDERPELQRPRARADRRASGPARRRLDRRRGAEPGSTSAGRGAAEPIGFGTRRCASSGWTAAHDDGRAGARRPRSSCRPSWPSTPTSPAGSSPSSSAASSPGGFERVVLGLSGGIDSALVAYLVAEAIGAERLLCVLMPYRTSSPASRGRRGGGRRRLGCASELVDISPMVDGYFDGRAGRADRRPTRAAPRQLHGPDADGRAVRPVGDVGRPRRRDRQQDRVAHRLHDAVRRQRVRVQPDRRPVQEPGPPAARPPSACPTRSSARRRRPTCGRARPTRPRAGSATRCSTGSCSGGSTSAGRSRRWSSSGFDARDGRAGRPDGRRRRVQAPGAADRQARAADGRRRLPVPAAAARAPPRGVSRRPTGRRAAGRCTSSPRRSATSATSRCGRSRSCGPVPLIAAEDTRLTRRLLGAPRDRDAD